MDRHTIDHEFAMKKAIEVWLKADKLDDDRTSKGRLFHKVAPHRLKLFSPKTDLTGGTTSRFGSADLVWTAGDDLEQFRE
jgi:hypothetical protein